MSKKTYAVVGSFAMKPGSQKGVHVFEYHAQDGSFVHLHDYRPQINAGQNSYNPEKDVFYFSDENMNRPNCRGGGGGLISFRLDHQTGEAIFLNDIDTLACLPSYICLEQTGSYAVVPHHATGSVITKTIRNEDGTFSGRVETDDAALTLVKLNEDGSFGKIQDVYTEPEVRQDGNITGFPHLHSCVQSPDGKLFLVCDKGLDMIHAFRVDTENGKISKVGQTFVEQGVHPRYGAFHPTLPIFYQNCENSVFAHVWKYESETGKLTKVQKIALMENEEEAAAWKQESASDIAITPDGKFAYFAIRGLNLLAAFAINEDGTLKFLQNISCGGKNPRGICLDPDADYLICMNRDTETLVSFRREPDGTLCCTDKPTECALPGNMRFVTYEI